MDYTTKKLSSQPTGGRYIAISCSCRTTNLAYEKEKDIKPGDQMRRPAAMMVYSSTIKGS